MGCPADATKNLDNLVKMRKVTVIMCLDVMLSMVINLEHEYHATVSSVRSNWGKDMKQTPLTCMSVTVKSASILHSH